MEKFVPVVVIKELSETDKILTALKASGINCAEITFRTACAAEAIAYACKIGPDRTKIRYVHHIGDRLCIYKSDDLLMARSTRQLESVVFGCS